MIRALAQQHPATAMVAPLAILSVLGLLAAWMHAAIVVYAIGSWSLPIAIIAPIMVGLHRAPLGTIRATLVATAGLAVNLTIEAAAASMQIWLLS